MDDGNSIVALEQVKASGDQPDKSKGKQPVPKGGFTIDLQTSAPGTKATVLQNVLIALQENGRSSAIFRVGTNIIKKDGNSISIKIGETRKIK